MNSGSIVQWKDEYPGSQEFYKMLEFSDVV